MFFLEAQLHHELGQQDPGAGETEKGRDRVMFLPELLMREVSQALVLIAIVVLLLLLVGAVILGGIKRIAQVAGKLVPFMAIAYLLAGLFGSNLQVWFQNPWIIGGFAAVFVALVVLAFVDSGEALIIQPDTALVLRPQGDVVEEYSGTPLDQVGVRVIDAHAHLGGYFNFYIPRPDAATMVQQMDRLGVVVGLLLSTVGTNAFVIEPVFFWPDELTEIHEDAVEDRHLARLPTRRRPSSSSPGGLGAPRDYGRSTHSWTPLAVGN